MRWLTLLVLLVALAGCGDDDDGGGTSTFDDERFGITFEYPSDFKEFDEVEFSQSLGGRATEQAAVGLDESNAIAVTRYELRRRVDASNLDQAQAELDSLISGAGVDAEAKVVEVGGLPGLEYEVAVPDIKGARARLTFLFDGKDEYLVTCQTKGENASELSEGCRTALSTLEKR